MADSNKAKCFSFITYPDSSDFELVAQTLSNLKIPFSRSPLHDSDVFDHDDDSRNIKKGDKKKSHYHWTLVFPGDRLTSSVLNLLGLPKEVVAKVMPCDDAQSTYDYEIHKNDDSKVQYNPSDRLTSPDFPVDSLSSYKSSYLQRI